jgi:hypothetical protein
VLRIHSWHLSIRTLLWDAKLEFLMKAAVFGHKTEFYSHFIVSERAYTSDAHGLRRFKILRSIAQNLKNAMCIPSTSCIHQGEDLFPYFRRWLKFM